MKKPVEDAAAVERQRSELARAKDALAYYQKQADACKERIAELESSSKPVKAHKHETPVS